MDNRLRGDLLEVMGSSALWFSLDDLVADLKVWPMSRGEKRRRDLTAAAVQRLLLKLVEEYLVIHDEQNGWRFRYETPKQSDDLQKRFF